MKLYGENCILSRNNFELVISNTPEACSGKHTLFAPNGLDVTNKDLLVANTNNVRIIYNATKEAISIFTGLKIQHIYIILSEIE